MPTRYIEVFSTKTHRKHHVLVYQPLRESRAKQVLIDLGTLQRVHLDDGRPLQWTSRNCFQQLRSDEEFVPVAKDRDVVRSLGFAFEPEPIGCFTNVRRAASG